MKAHILTMEGIPEANTRVSCDLLACLSLDTNPKQDWSGVNSYVSSATSAAFLLELPGQFVFFSYPSYVHYADLDVVMKDYAYYHPYAYLIIGSID